MRSECPPAFRARVWFLGETKMTGSLLKLSLRVLAAARVRVFLLALCASMALAQGQTNPVANSQPSNTPKKTSPATTSVSSSAPECKGGVLVSTPAGKHTVVLTWNANLPKEKVIGYCVFRRTKAHIPPDVSKCTDCERLNTVPVPKAGCVDTKVPDTGVTYYYVVTAINDAGMSPASNEATPNHNKPPTGFLSCE
jgi:hypothetical protein